MPPNKHICDRHNPSSRLISRRFRKAPLCESNALLKSEALAVYSFYCYVLWRRQLHNDFRTDTDTIAAAATMRKLVETDQKRS